MEKEVYVLIILRDLLKDTVEVYEDLQMAADMFKEITGIDYGAFESDCNILPEEFVGSDIIPTDLIKKEDIKYMKSLAEEDVCSICKAPLNNSVGHASGICNNCIAVKDMTGDFLVNVFNGKTLLKHLPAIYSELSRLSKKCFGICDISQWYVRAECYEEYFYIFASEKLEDLDSDMNPIINEWQWGIMSDEDIKNIRSLMAEKNVLD